MSLFFSFLLLQQQSMFFIFINEDKGILMITDKPFVTRPGRHRRQLFSSFLYTSVDCNSMYMSAVTRECVSVVECRWYNYDDDHGRRGRVEVVATTWAVISTEHSCNCLNCTCCHYMHEQQKASNRKDRKMTFVIPMASTTNKREVGNWRTAMRLVELLSRSINEPLAFNKMCEVAAQNIVCAMWWTENNSLNFWFTIFTKAMRFAISGALTLRKYVVSNMSQTKRDPSRNIFTTRARLKCRL